MTNRNQRALTSQRLTLWLGPPCAFAIAKLTAQQTDGLSIANTALILAIVTTAIGSLNPLSGILTSFTAGAFLNYFHTDPVNSFRMSSTNDILMISLFTALGLGVSIITSFRMRHNIIATNRDSMHIQQEATMTAASSSQHATQFWQSFIEHIDPNLSFLDVCCTTRPKEELPTIARRTSVSTDSSTVLIPECGAVVEFQDPRISKVLILKPVKGFAPLEVSRAAIFALSSDVELSLQGTIEE
jgi:K+-sensing histidine kinase KdpD